MVSEDWATQKAQELLPCLHAISGLCWQGHLDNCPAFYRPAVADALLWESEHMRAATVGPLDFSQPRPVRRPPIDRKAHE